MTLDELDRIELERCVREDMEFPDSLLADEAVLLRFSTWEYEECCRIDWKLHEERAKSKAAVWANDFEEFRKIKQQILDQPKKRKRKDISHN